MRINNYKLEYSLSRPYPWRWYTSLTLGVFSFLIGVLTVVNVALVGFDLVTIQTTDFNQTLRKPTWYEHVAALKQKETSCSPATFDVGSTFRTSVGALDYQILAIGDPDTGAFNILSPPSVQYSNSPLSNCDIVNLSMSSHASTFFSAWTMTIICPPPFPIRAVATWTHGSPFEDSFIKYIGTFGSLKPSPEERLRLSGANGVAVQDVFGAINDDFINENRGDPNTGLLFNYQAMPSCTGGSCSRENDQQTTEILMSADYNWNQVDSNGNFRASDQSGWEYFAAGVSLQNMFQALLSGVRLDLGHLTPNNIFTNSTALHSAISDKGSVTTFTQPLLVKGTGSRLLGQLPLTVDSSEFVVARVNYLCTQSRLKTGLTLVSSVFASTATMIISIWGIWGLCAAYFAQRTHDELDRRELALTTILPYEKDQDTVLPMHSQDSSKTPLDHETGYLLGQNSSSTLHQNPATQLPTIALV